MCAKIHIWVIDNQSFPGVSYARTQSSASLPVHLTSVGCYGSEEKLIDCGHHEYTTSDHSIDFDYYYYDVWYTNNIVANPSMDISISCFSSVDSTSTSSTEVDSVSTISLIISIISLSAVIVLVAVLIIVVVLFRKRTKRWVKIYFRCASLLDCCDSCNFHAS